MNSEGRAGFPEPLLKGLHTPISITYPTLQLHLYPVQIEFASIKQSLEVSITLS